MLYIYIVNYTLYILYIKYCVVQRNIIILLLYVYIKDHILNINLIFKFMCIYINHIKQYKLYIYRFYIKCLKLQICFIS